MNKEFKLFFSTTKGFFFIRLGGSLVVALLYVIVAGFIQALFVNFFGENTFNYIVGGLMSLFVGIIFCHFVGQAIFMFIKGWHVSALAYSKKIDEKHLSALDVGARAFRKNFISFGAVYVVREIFLNILNSFKEKLWEVLGNVPYVAYLKNYASHPAVEYLASDILHYGFDAMIFYLIGHPTEDLNDMPATVLEGIKRYLYCLPSIILASLQSYILFRFLPTLAKGAFLLWAFLTQGIVAGILLTVLMYPVFYVLDNIFFDPLTMMLFLSIYAKRCDDDFSEDPIASSVNQILEEATLDGDDEQPKEEKKEETPEPQPNDAWESEGEEEPLNDNTAPARPKADLSSLSDLIGNAMDSLDSLDFDEGPCTGPNLEEETEEEDLNPADSMMRGLSTLRDIDMNDLLADPLGNRDRDDDN